MTGTLTATDLFWGAGGSSLGLAAAGVELRMAANHWALAVESHAANFTGADHDCADVSQVLPRRYPRTDILLASPECTTHSLAGPRRHEPNLFNPEGDPEVERSRATMWDVPRFAEEHRYRSVAFPGAYIVKGAKRDPVRQLGNAVTPPVMRMIVKRCVESLDG